MATIGRRRLIKFRGEDRFAFVEQYKRAGSPDAGGGVKWASCDKGITSVEWTPIYTDVGGKGRGMTGVMWLFVIPALAGLGIAIGVATPGITLAGVEFAAISAINQAIATLGMSLIGLTGLQLMPILERLGNMIGSLLPIGSRVQFVKFTKPCIAEE